MSFPTYNDFAKDTEDLFNDDFDTKCTLKVKSAAPAGVGLTTTTDLSHAANVYPTKVSLKWAHSSGFAVDKLEMAGCDKSKLETSLSNVPYAPGLKVNFKGADLAAGSLGVEYRHKLATLASELDIAGFSSLSASVYGGAKGIGVGGAALVALGSKFEVKDFSAGVSYAPTEGIFVGVRGNKKFTEFDAALQYKYQPSLAFALLGDCVPKTSTHNVCVGVKYECCAGTAVKVKVSSQGDLNASVKKSLSKDMIVVGTAGVQLKNPEAFTIGMSATIG